MLADPIQTVDAVREPRRTKVSEALSARQKQILRLIIKGEPNKIIAFELHLSEGTVKEYLFRFFKKVGVTNRTALAVWGVDNPAALE